MAREPSYPNDAPVGASAPAAPASPTPPASPAEPASPAAPAPAEDARAGSDSRRKKHLMAGAAIGIGSAAIVAALLYANRGRRDRS